MNETHSRIEREIGQKQYGFIRDIEKRSNIYYHNTIRVSHSTAKGCLPRFSRL